MTATLVLVTYNRIALLKKTLEAYFRMEKQFDTVMIIDNHSSDGTGEWLSQFALGHGNVHVTFLPENLGGAGGFARGVEIALKESSDEWIFVADDDAIPEPDMLLQLERGYNGCKDGDKIAAVCTSVVNNGTYDLNHRRIIRKGTFKLKNISANSDFDAPFYVDEATFVGLMVKTDVARKIGLPKADLFIFYDDTEYSFRIRREGTILCIPSARMKHDTKMRAAGKATWRDYYMVRNELWYLHQYYPARYFRFRAFVLYWKRASLLAKLVKHRDREERTLFKTAISDAKNNRLGIHPVYRPL